MESLTEDKLTYESYLKVPELLGLQTLLSPHHDEMLFILIHQVYELWFKELLHELDEVVRCFNTQNIQRAVKVLNRVTTIQDVLVTQISVLETMTPNEFAEFRDKLRPASGFQSVQFREVEFLSGLKNPRFMTFFEHLPEALARLQKRYEAPTLYQHFLRLLNEAGFAGIDASLWEDPLKSPPHEHEPVLSALESIYRNPQAHYELYMLCESLVTYDENLSLWRYRHVKMVERTIGTKTGTGGSSGAQYLKSTLDDKCFPDLWEVRNRIGSY